MATNSQNTKELKENSKELKELTSSIGNLDDLIRELFESNTDIIKSNNELVKSIGGFVNQQNKNAKKAAVKTKSENKKKPKVKEPDTKKDERSAKKGMDSMFKGIESGFLKNINKMFGGKILKRVETFSKNLEAGGVKGKFSGSGYYDEKGKIIKQFKGGVIPKGAKRVTDEAEHRKKFGASMFDPKKPKGGFAGAGYYDPKTGDLIKEGLSRKGSKLIQNKEEYAAKMPMNAAGKSKAAGALGQAGSSIMRGAAGLLRAAGPIGAAFAVGMKVVDFFNSGKAAQTFSDVATFFGGAGAGKETTTALFKMSKQYRDIVADYNIMAPVKEKHAQERDMLEYEKSIASDNLRFEQDLVKDKFNLEMDRAKSYIDFAHQKQMKVLDAELDKRKTLFVTGMTQFGKFIKASEAALQAIGSSTEQVFSSIVGVAKNLGASVKDQIRMSTGAQGLSKQLGVSAEETLNMGNAFRLMNNTSLEIGMNLVAGIKEFADENGRMAQVVMKDMVDSSADIYKFSDGTAENFAKQAVALNKMGTSMSAMLKASDSMVLNYKDSIKAEMGLSAMLGKNVDLSETRAKLMSGDQKGAAESLRGALGDVDIKGLNPFAKQQLTKATGMDIEQLLSIQQGGDGDVSKSLEERNAEKAGIAIAEGALKIQNDNDKKRMEADLAHQEKMMKFEQDKRKGMMFIEQMQRLEGIALETKFRIKTAKMESEQDVERAVAEMQKESSAKLINNLFVDNAKTFRDNLIKQNITADSEAFKNAMKGFEEKQEQIKQYTAGLVQSGVLTSENAGAIMADIGVKIAKGKGQEVTVDYVQQQLKDQGAFERNQKEKEDALAKAQSDLAAAIDAGSYSMGGKVKRRRVDKESQAKVKNAQLQVEAAEKALADAKKIGGTSGQVTTASANNTGGVGGSVSTALIEAAQKALADAKKIGGTSGFDASLLTPIKDTSVVTAEIKSNDHLRGIKMANDNKTIIAQNNAAAAKNEMFTKQNNFASSQANEMIKYQAYMVAGMDKLVEAANAGKTIPLNISEVQSKIDKLAFKQMKMA